MIRNLEIGKSRTVQASWLALANLLSLSVGLFISAILSRFMSITEYGTYRQVFYVYSTLLIIFSMGIPKAYSYFLPRVPVEEGKDIVRKLSLLFLAFSSCFSIVLFFGAGTISEWLGNPLLTDNLKYFAIIPMLLMPVMGVESILTVYGLSRLVVIYVVISRISMIVCTVFPVIILKAGVSGAIMGFVVSSLASSLVGLRLSTTPFKNVISAKTNLTIKNVFQFSLPALFSSVYGFIISSSSQFFVSRYFGVEDFALFANGYRELPLAGMVISATAGVLQPEFSRMSKTGADSSQFVKLWKNVIFKSSSIIYPISVFCCLFAPEIVCLLYGNNYREAAHLFRIVTIINLTRIVPYGPILFALGKGWKFANAHLVTALLLVGLDLLCVHLFPSLPAIAIIAASTTLFCLVMLMAAIARLLKTPLVELMPWQKMLKILVVSIPVGFMTKIAISLTGMTNNFIIVSAGFVIYMSSYVFIALRSGVDYAEVFHSLTSETSIVHLIKSKLKNAIKQR